MTDEQRHALEPDTTAVSPYKRKHKKYRYRRTGTTARKVLLVVGTVAFWSALLAGWYYLVTLERATPR